MLEFYNTLIQNGSSEPLVTKSLHRDINILTLNGQKFIQKSSRVRLDKEFSLMQSFNRPEIGKVLYLISPLSYIMEYYPKGNLNIDNPIEEKTAKSYFKQICKCIEILHSNNIVHLDIRLCNFVLGDDEIIKIIDFGHSTDDNCDNIHHEMGSIKYNSPERYLDCYNGYKADIFSLGVCIFRMLTGSYPFPNTKEACPHYRLFKNSPENYWKRFSVHLKKHNKKIDLSENTLDLIFWMLENNPNDRPNIHQVLSHNFFIS
ncbi:hypothetical protein SteCoe_7445 [Stentor coeruleus]|uniref:Protein kinase domain-containing protein n=1 Tax=Stentor coeruleus TaxID=5963 RepID=A0A1R2CMJ8_9CILI|nr:hypothetical protein SteCoe_7445 [Stentor coeruleus]